MLGALSATDGYQLLIHLFPVSFHDRCPVLKRSYSQLIYKSILRSRSERKWPRFYRRLSINKLLLPPTFLPTSFKIRGIRFYFNKQEWIHELILSYYLVHWILAIGGLLKINLTNLFMLDGCADGTENMLEFSPPLFEAAFRRRGWKITSMIFTLPGSWSKLTNGVDMMLSTFGNARQRFVPVATKDWKKGIRKTIVMDGFRSQFKVTILP